MNAVPSRRVVERPQMCVVPLPHCNAVAAYVKSGELFVSRELHSLAD